MVDYREGGKGRVKGVGGDSVGGGRGGWLSAGVKRVRYRMDGVAKGSPGGDGWVRGGERTWGRFMGGGGRGAG
jgi:hypothetical protein